MDECCSINVNTYKYVNGDIIVREYNQTLVNKKTYAKNREKLTTSKNCECGGRYTPKNKYEHFNTKRHNIQKV